MRLEVLLSEVRRGKNKKLYRSLDFKESHKLKQQQAIPSNDREFFGSTHEGVWEEICAGLSGNQVAWEDVPGTESLGSQGPGGQAKRAGVSPGLAAQINFGPADHKESSPGCKRGWATVASTRSTVQS